MLRVKGFISPKALIFWFYQCNLNLYKLILPSTKFHNHPSMRKIFAQNFSATKYGFFLDKLNLPCWGSNSKYVSTNTEKKDI